MPKIRLLLPIYLLFSLSGFAGLIYESIWARYMKLLLGHSSYGQILTLVIFMGGLGLGSFLGGKYARIFKNPLYLYAFAEVSIGIGGLFYHNLYKISSQGLFQLAGSFTSIPWLFFLLKLAVAALITFPWAVLLGLTFPALAIGVIDLAEDTGRNSLPWLYFTNSLGGAIGVLVSSFFLIERFGTIGTLSLAGMLNIGLGLIFYFIARQFWPESRPNKVATAKEPTLNTDSYLKPHSLGRVLLWVSFFTGFSSFLYEICWIRLLALLMGSSTHAFDLMLSAFILGLASGSLVVRYVMKKTRTPLKALAWVQLLMGLFAALSLVFYQELFPLMNQSHSILAPTPEAYTLYSGFRYVLCLFLMFPASFFAGMTLPLITWLVLHLFKQERAVGQVYGYNTLGAILGAALGGLWLLPLLQLKGALLVAALIDVLIGLGLWGLAKTPKLRLAVATALSVALLLPVFLLELNAFTLSSGLFREAIDLQAAAKAQIKAPLIRHGRTATVSFHDYGNLKVIKTNGKTDASVTTHPDMSQPNDEMTQSSAGIYPMQVMKAPYEAAMIGLGSGMTVQHLLCDPLLKHLDMIEIEPEIYNLAKGFSPFNDRVYTSPKIRPIFDDARTFFFSQNKQYDLIISEPSNPWVSGVSSLFTQEFYQDIRRFLKPEGLLVQWIQSYEFDSRLLLSILKALKTQFPYISIYGLPGVQADQTLPSNLIIMASPKRLLFPAPQDLRKIPELDQELKRLGLTSQSFDGSYRIATEQTLQALIDNYNPNSDYFPVVDSQAELDRFTNKSVDLHEFLLFTPIYYQSVFEPDFSTLIKQRLHKGDQALKQLLLDLDYKLSAPPALRDTERLSKDFTYLITRFMPILDWQSPVLKKYRAYLAQNKELQIQAIEFDFLSLYADPDLNKSAAAMQALLSFPPEVLSPTIIRAMALKAIQSKNLQLYQAIIEKVAQPHPQITSIEKELMRSFLPK
jgi:spermidine synthase